MDTHLKPFSPKPQEPSDVLLDACSVISDSDEGSDVEGDEDPSRLIDEATQSLPEGEVGRMRTTLLERGIKEWFSEYIGRRKIPLLTLILAFGVVPSKRMRSLNSDPLFYPILKRVLYFILRQREKLPNCNTIDDVCALLRRSQNILVLTGAGISTSCGIPDFRSRNGLYALLSEQLPEDLNDPQQMFDIQYFKERPEVFFYFAKHIYPSNFQPSPSHRFIKLLEQETKLLRNYTQNIDTLETKAGVKKVIQCHGSFKTATCTLCRSSVSGSTIEDAIMSQKIPFCTTCQQQSELLGKPSNPRKAKIKWAANDSSDEEDSSLPIGVLKPDIVFFGEDVNDEFDKYLFEDRNQVDLLLVMGTSLKVAPVSETLMHLPHSTPQVLINKTPIPHANFDVMLLGDSDTIVHHLCNRLGWTLPGDDSVSSDPTGNRKRRAVEEPHTISGPRRLGNSHVWLFEGAEPGGLLTLSKGTDASDSETSSEDAQEISERKGKRARGDI